MTTKTATPKLSPWARPKPLVRKPFDDGERVTWTTQGHQETPGHLDAAGQYIPATYATVEHWGIVWSAGPLPASAWVAEEGDTARMIAIKKPSKTGPARPADWWHENRTR